MSAHPVRAGQGFAVGDPLHQQLTVQLGERSYPILIGAGLLDRADLIDTLLPARKVAVVTNTVVSPLYFPQLRRSLGDREVVEVVLVVVVASAGASTTTT